MTKKKTAVEIETVSTAPAASPATPSLAANAVQPTASITGVANGNNTGTKIDLQTSYQSLVSGLLTSYQPTDVFPIKSGTLTRDDVIGQLQAYVKAAENTKASNKTWRAHVQAERAVQLQISPTRQGVRSILEARYGKGGVELLTFGFAPRKPTKKTVATKMAAVEKSTATREARGTRGSRQKKAIKGAVKGEAPAAETTTTASPAPAATTKG